MRVLLRLVTVLTALLPVPALSADGKHYFRVEIDKSEQRLQVLREREVVREYRIAYGRGGSNSKQRSGDNRTPEGEYRIIGINTESRFELFFLLDYPNPADVELALDSGVIQRRHYHSFRDAWEQNEVPPQHTPLGGWIGIHGLGFSSLTRQRAHERRNWTEGCIALTNREIHDLRRYVKIGTPVTIRR